MKRRTWRLGVIVNRRTRAMVGVIRNLRNSSGGRKRGVAKALALPVLLLIAFGGDAEPRVSPACDGQDPGSYRISVNVDLVVLTLR